MPKYGSLDSIIGKASELEKNYGWLKAAEFYRKALKLVPETDFFKMGQVQERIGYALYRAAMQAESKDEFRDGMRQVVAGYKKAKEFYEKSSGQGKQPRTIRCDAMIAFVGYWLASEVPGKKRLLGECWGLTKESLKAFKDAGDAWEYGLTFNQLSSSVALKFCFEWDFQARKKLMGDAVERGEQAIKFLSAFEDSSELARAYGKTAFYLGAFNYYFLEMRDSQRVQDYWWRAKELSEEIALLELLYPVFGAHIVLWGDATNEALTNLKKALVYGRKTRDKFIIGCAFDWLTYHSGWGVRMIENPEERSKFGKRVLKYAENAKQQYSQISFVSPRADSYWVEWMHIEYNWMSAGYETEARKKRDLLERAREAATEALERAESSECPHIIGYVNHLLSEILFSLAPMETNSSEKRNLLEEALKRRKESIRIVEQLEPFIYWDHGVQLGELAKIKYRLADLIKDPETQKGMIQESVVDRENSLQLAIKGISSINTGLGFLRNLALIQYGIGVWLNRLYELTNDKENLRKAAKALAEAAESYQRVNLKRRVAECHWKAAQTYDALGEHLNAAESFESASENYSLAAKKVPQFTGFYSDYASYMRTWAEIERARHERENENYAKSREHYRLCSGLLEMTEKWSYLSPYYFAWSLLDHGETLSRLDRPQDAIKVFNEAGRTFGDSANSLRDKAEQLENSEERDEALKLTTTAGLRKQYCMGRVLMEEATLSNRKGDRSSSANKYASAARIFKRIAPNLEREQARGELQFAAAICEAWEKMELAEERGDAVLYRNAAELFAKAGETSRRKTAKLTAMGNSCFCEALEMGMKFMATSNTDFYSAAKLRMENAAGYYQRAGFKKPALWVEATKKFFDAYVYAGKAEAEPEPEKKVRFFLMAEKCLELSAKSYGKAGYRGKKNEVLRSLEKTRKERELAFSLREVLTAPAVLSSAAGVSMPDLTEKPAGLNDFESVNIRASVSAPDEFIPGEEFQVKLDLANVGNKPGLIVRIDGLVPSRCEVLRVSSHCVLEGASLNMRGRRLDPLSVESVSVWVQMADAAVVSLSPEVVYVDEVGNFRTTRVEEAKILPVVKFESKAAQVIFNYLVDAFIEDYEKRRLSVEKSGWRSFPQIIKGAGVSKRSLYGAGGRLGYGLSELQRKSLIDLETLLGERGRGGHILRVRIHHEKELVRRYVREKAPHLLT